MGERIRGIESMSIHEQVKLVNRELNFLLDDNSDPEEVTIFPEDEDKDIRTHWISVGYNDAVEFENWI